jgi:hypothetical protein
MVAAESSPARFVSIEGRLSDEPHLKKKSLDPPITKKGFIPGSLMLPCLPKFVLLVHFCCSLKTLEKEKMESRTT